MDTTFVKPKIGQPCNGCGLCCMIHVCYNGAYIQGLVDNLGDRINGRCPALTERKDGSFGCGIDVSPKKYIKNRPYPEEVLRRNFMHLIGAGNGCDEIGFDDDPEEERKQDEMVYGIKNGTNWEKKTKIALKVIYGIE